MGNIKFDIAAPQSLYQKSEQLKQDWQLLNRQVITLASTHSPEEENLLRQLQTTFKFKSKFALYCGTTSS